MSDNPLHSGTKLKSEHGDMKSYVIGFILSLVFTFIPYFMVVNETVSGTALLATILGFAILQMIVQITFFLHLGRGPKPNWNLFFFVSTIGIILIVVGGSIVIINNLHYNKPTSDQTKKLIGDEAIYQIGGQKTGACQGQYANHKVTIVNNQVSPMYSVAQRCDTLTFLNEDTVLREITFGPHPQHQAYAGETDLKVRKSSGKTITLSEAGKYQFHDHSQPETIGYFTVIQ